MLYENDDYGKDMLDGLKKGLHGKAKIVGTASYELTDSDMSAQIAALKATRADTLALFALPKQVIQAFLAAHKLGWNAHYFLSGVSIDPFVMNVVAASTSKKTTKGAISAAFLKVATDPRLAKDKGAKLYKAIMKSYCSGCDVNALAHVYGMAAAYTMVDALKHAGKNPTARLAPAGGDAPERDLESLRPGGCRAEDVAERLHPGRPDAHVPLLRRPLERVGLRRPSARRLQRLALARTALPARLRSPSQTKRGPTHANDPEIARPRLRGDGLARAGGHRAREDAPAARQRLAGHGRERRDGHRGEGGEGATRRRCASRSTSRSGTRRTSRRPRAPQIGTVNADLQALSISPDAIIQAEGTVLTAAPADLRRQHVLARHTRRRVAPARHRERPDARRSGVRRPDDGSRGGVQLGEARALPSESVRAGSASRVARCLRREDHRREADDGRRRDHESRRPRARTSGAPW